MITMILPSPQEITMGKKGRKNYTDDFKHRAVAALRVPGATVASVARDVKIHPTLLRQWKNKATPGSDGGKATRAGVIAILEAEAAKMEKRVTSIREAILILKGH
jgi:transposase-like protein